MRLMSLSASAVSAEFKTRSSASCGIWGMGAVAVLIGVCAVPADPRTALSKYCLP
jgi:hypothetical protein